MTDKEGFAARWSRMKREEPAEPPAPEPAPVEDDRPDEEILDELGLLHPDELQPGDDVSGFMKAVVPDRLRRMALRSLWRSNPVLANVDGLVDYGDDFTDAATVMEKLETVYQVGKGMLRDLAETTEEEAAAPVAEQEAPEPEAAPEAVAVADEAPEVAPEAAEDEAELAEPQVSATPRRMAFRFDGA